MYPSTLASAFTLLRRACALYWLRFDWCSALYWRCSANRKPFSGKWEPTDLPRLGTGETEGRGHQHPWIWAYMTALLSCTVVLLTLKKLRAESQEDLCEVGLFQWLHDLGPAPGLLPPQFLCPFDENNTTRHCYLMEVMWQWNKHPLHSLITRMCNPVTKRLEWEQEVKEKKSWFYLYKV